VRASLDVGARGIRKISNSQSGAGLGRLPGEPGG